MSNKIKVALSLCLAFLFAGPLQAQVSSLQVTYGSTQGNFTLTWNSFASPHYVKENGVTISNTSASTKTYNRSPGTYTYMVSSCDYTYEPGCIQSNSVTVTVVASPPPPPPPAAPLEFTVGSLQQFMNLARGQDKSLANLIGDEIETRLRNSNLSFDENGLTYSENLPDIQIRSGCSKNYQLRHLQVAASLNNASRFDILMDSLSRPIIASAQLIGTVEASGQVRVRLGFKVFGECIRYLKASVDGSVRTDFTINANLLIKLNPSRVTNAPAGAIKIAINPQATLTGNMQVTNTSATVSNANLSILGINVFSGVVGNLLEKQILKLVNNGLNGSMGNLSGPVNTYFQQYLVTAQAEINNKLLALPQTYTVYVDSAASNDALSFLSYYALNYLPPAGFLQANSTDLLYLLLVGDDKGVRERIATSLQCNSSADALMLTMNRAATPVPYRTTTRSDFCANIDNKSWLGNAEPAVSGYTNQDSWTLTPATSFNLSVVAPIASNYQPYMQRVQYRAISGITSGTRTEINYTAYGAAMSACYSAGHGTCNNPPNINNYTTTTPIPRGNGTCKLEMRVYKKDVAQTGLKPLLAIHGGSWKYRGLAFYGMESQISQFTEQGFVVFAPFYRLTGDMDGNVECNNATGEQIVSDVDAALTWVQNNKTTYGVSSYEKVRLFGQSAGAHLSGYLLTHRATEVQKALLMYPPTDARDYIVNYQAYTTNQAYSSEYAHAFGGQGEKAVEGYLSPVGGQAVSLRDVDPNSTLVANNSFPTMVASSPAYYPPVYLVHGKVDQLVPAINSVRLCNAYTGNPSSGNANTAGTAPRQAFVCGPSRVDLLQEANHGLEICLPPIRCEAGSSTSALAAATQALSEARAWLAQ
jgi:acetyl esterase/lipase